VTIFCGIDWVEDHHDIAIIDAAGTQLAKRRIGDDAAGYASLLQLLAEHGETADELAPVAIETGRGLLVACLAAGGRDVYVVNAMAAARYRERTAVARAKSDAGDALMLANILRTDRHAHRPMPHDSDLVRAIAVLARAGQDAAWSTQQIANQLRSVLREYFPAALRAFQIKHVGLASAEARTILAAAPTPTTAARLTKARLRTLLKQAGRQRKVEVWVERLQGIFRDAALHHSPRVEDAFGQQARALLLQLNAAVRATEGLLAAAEAAFLEHPDAEIIISFPGLGTVTGARVLAELGDDRDRFTNPRALKAYAGAAPVTRASGKVRLVMHRRVKNDRLAAAGYTWPSPR
jgi:transposase